ncbi:MAG: glycosyltransferase [Clostridia bacterium]|nr:glycosyltransferase [Clostridia bacterium]
MKKISIMIPCYNEEENVKPISEAVTAMLEKDLPQYDYEILFIDNASKDKTREYLEEICTKNKKIKAIFNTKNFGQFNSPFYGMLQTTGDCTICMCCDFQDPVDMVPKFIEEWEKGYKVVCGIKTASKESHIVYTLRSFYYKTIKKLSDVDQIEHFTGFGLYDKSFMDVLRSLDDPTPFIRGIVAELGPERKEIEYCQPQRRAGKTHNNWASLFDAAMLSFTSYTKTPIRIATITGAILTGLNIFLAILYIIFACIFTELFSIWVIPILISIFLVGSVLLFFVGMVGEYILNINKRVLHRPLVTEEKRINFD